MVGFSKIGYGPKKTECQDSYCTLDSFTTDCHFMAVYDGHVLILLNILSQTQ